MEGKLPVTSDSSLKCSQRSSEQDSSQRQTHYSDCSATSKFQTDAERGQVPPSHASSSFLCFLTKPDGGPNLIQSNEISLNNLQSLAGSSSLSVSRKNKQVNEISNRTHGSVNITKAARSNAVYNNAEATLGSASIVQKTPPEIGSSDANSDCAENGGSKTMGHELELSGERKGKFSHQIEHLSDISGHHGHTTEAAEEEDEKAFEITQFFEAFKEGNDYLLNSLSKESESPGERVSRQADELTPGLEPSTSNLATSEDQLILDRCGSSEVLRDEGNSDSTVLEHSNNVGYQTDFVRNGAVNFARESSRDDVHSGFPGKWYEDVEPGDSVSVTFSGPLPFSGPLHYSGPISYSGHSGQVLHSGSVSHRSDSSNASTHSFAFPILPFEWNSSPVKMAKPDKRLRRQGWKGCLYSYFCCK